MVIVVRLEAGLGNQLFQYSYGLALQLQHGGRLMFDRRLVRGDPAKVNALGQIADIAVEGFADPLIPFALRYYAGTCIRVVRLLQGQTDEAARWLARLGVHHQFKAPYIEHKVAKLPFVYLHGNWMSEKYFASAVEHVRSSVHPARALGPQTRDVACQIASTASVAIHIRRGDYLNDHWRARLHVCSGDYYERAIGIIREQVERPTFFVFSNNIEDLEWIRYNYRFLPDRTVFVPPGASDVEHFALMALCRHFIIANSTFSWWASYLSANGDKVVVAPSPWNRNAWDMTDLYCPGWKIVDVDLGAALSETRGA